MKTLILQKVQIYKKTITSVFESKKINLEVRKPNSFSNQIGWAIITTTN